MSFLDNLARQARGIKAQIDPTDGGATYRSVTQGPQRAIPQGPPLNAPWLAQGLTPQSVPGLQFLSGPQAPYQGMPVGNGYGRHQSLPMGYEDHPYPVVQGTQNAEFAQSDNQPFLQYGDTPNRQYLNSYYTQGQGVDPELLLRLSRGR